MGICRDASFAMSGSREEDSLAPGRAPAQQGAEPIGTQNNACKRGLKFLALRLRRLTYHADLVIVNDGADAKGKRFRLPLAHHTRLATQLKWHFGNFGRQCDD